jgi:hypothetical protein
VTESWFSHRTIDPAFTVMVGGSNAKFFITIVFADTDARLIGVGTDVMGVWVVAVGGVVRDVCTG